MGKESQKQETVKVMVRARPMNSKEIQQNCKNVLLLNKDERQIQFKQDYNSICAKTFVYDNVFDENDTQQHIYEQSAFSIIESVISGYNGTIFAYGQTGCGKTYSMLGDINNIEKKGIIPRACSHIINKLSSIENQLISCNITCSFIEIYNEQIYDLLSSEKCKREIKVNPKNGIFLKDLIKFQVNSVQDIITQLQNGEKNRSVGATAMNSTSSRSHCIFTIQITNIQKNKNIETIKNSKLNLVDLAGSERQSKTQAKDQRLKEANAINLSLSTLGNVISALVSKKKVHIPYRDSKLTRLLQDSLGGNTKTLMMAAISPADYNIEETISTLKYASRTSLIKNDPKINEDPRDAMIKKFEQELQSLKNQLKKDHKQTDMIQLQKLNNDDNFGDISKTSSHTQDVLQQEICKRQELEEQIKEMKNQYKIIDQKENKKQSIIGNEKELYYIKEVQKKLIQQRENFDKQKKEIMTKNIDKKQELELLKQELKNIAKENENVSYSINEETQQHILDLKQKKEELLILKQIAYQMYSKQELNMITNKTTFDAENQENVKIPNYILEDLEENQVLPVLHQNILGTKQNNQKGNINQKKESFGILQPLNNNMKIYTPKKNNKQRNHNIQNREDQLQQLLFCEKTKSNFQQKNVIKSNEKISNIARIKLQPIQHNTKETDARLSQLNFLNFTMQA